MAKKAKEFLCGSDIDLKCPRCKAKKMRIVGIRHNENKVEIECSYGITGCMYSEYVPKFEKEEDVVFSYVKPKSRQEIADEKAEKQVKRGRKR